MPPMIRTTIERWIRKDKRGIMSCHHCKTKEPFRPEDFYKVFKQVVDRNGCYE